MSDLFSAFWHGRPLPLLQWVCLSTYIAHGHRVRLYVYDEIDVPTGVELVDARSVVPESELFYYENSEAYGGRDLGPFSDYFRFNLLAEHGGWYVDTDVMCTSRHYPSCDYAWALEHPEINVSAVGTSQIKLKGRSPIAMLLRRECVARRRSMRRREDIGPALLSEIVARLPPGLAWGSADEFYPLRWIESYKLWVPAHREEVHRRSKPAFFLNCWNSLAMYMGLSHDIAPPRASFLRELYEGCAPGRVPRKEYSSDQVLELIRTWFLRRQWAIDELILVDDGGQAAHVLGINRDRVGVEDDGDIGIVRP